MLLSFHVGCTGGSAFFGSLAKTDAAATAVVSAQARQDYVIGINTLRARCEQCKTPDDVLKLLGEISGERAGGMLSPFIGARLAVKILLVNLFRARLVSLSLRHL